MPRSSSAAAVNNMPRVRSPTAPRITRAQISSPIPITEALDKELSIRPQEIGFSGHMPQHTSTAKTSMDNSRPSGEFSRRRISLTPMRSRSVLRTAFSKIFGRKKVPRPMTGLASVGSEEDLSDQRYHAPSSPTPAQNPLPNMSESLPISEYDRALRSHSVGPEDVIAIQTARSSVNADYSGHQRRRAGTGSDAHPASARWVKPTTGLTPRPASTQDWGSRLVDESHDPEEIGRAITTGLKRRSRSLSFIPLIDETTPTPSITRRRSDEFPRGWRESCEEATSPMSSTGPGGEDGATFISDRSDDEAKSDDGLQDEVESPVKPFEFSNMPYMTEFAGGASMKITDAVGLETRIGQVENRLSLVEGILTHVRQGTPLTGLGDDASERLAPPMPAWSSTFPTAARPSSHSSAQFSGTSRLSFGEVPIYARSASQQTTKHSAFASPERTTLASSLPTLSKSVPAGSFIMDHETYNTILTTMENDRAARIALEAQVRELSRQVSRLSRNLPSACAAPTQAEGGQTSVHDFADAKNLGMSDKKDHNEDSGIGTEPGDREYPDSFATLNDESHNPGHYREEAEAPLTRPNTTLSLSKLTMLGDVGYPTSQQALSQTV
ncbi:hypothetical protein M419DRAFT_33973 [Trichoderma reesei RUT C-30]|uniref:Uncharacterized protein n=1 Tax=Hypocrea jecorina (strain ATCC 56765 / BCRC 32924 / NRRL 11460 / Rut C-30) TaxID=1344414 RepID=A0A024SF42_HYPJR|nr:hypothetical protein M419DRAFT_33973 [Trichoderma reesei RUT C-30]